MQHQKIAKWLQTDGWIWPNGCRRLAGGAKELQRGLDTAKWLQMGAWTYIAKWLHRDAWRSPNACRRLAGDGQRQQRAAWRSPNACRGLPGDGRVPPGASAHNCMDLQKKSKVFKKLSEF